MALSQMSPNPPQNLLYTTWAAGKKVTLVKSL